MLFFIILLNREFLFKTVGEEIRAARTTLEREGGRRRVTKTPNGYNTHTKEKKITGASGGVDIDRSLTQGLTDFRKHQ